MYEPTHHSRIEARLRRLPFVIFALAGLCGTAVWPQTLAAQTASSWTLDGVVAMLDRSAQDFHTLTADIEHIKYTAVVKDSGGRFVLAGALPFVRKALDLTKLSSVVSLAADTTSGLAVLRGE